MPGASFQQTHEMNMIDDNVTFFHQAEFSIIKIDLICIHDENEDLVGIILLFWVGFDALLKN